MDEKWTSIIKAKTGWFDIDIRELLKYRDLIYLFVKRNYATRYKQTILGPLWLIINPLLTTLMFTVIFGKIAGMGTDGVPELIFYMSGNIVWSYFALCINQTSRTFVENAAVFGKVYFPRLTTPIAVVLTGVLDFLIQLVMLVLFMAWYWSRGIPIHFRIEILLTPFLILQLAMLGLGCGIIVSALTTKYRDLVILVTFGVQLWMYASPVVYSVTQIPEKYLGLYMMNPVAPIISMFRYAYLGVGVNPYSYWAESWFVTIIILAVGIIMFSKIEKTFMDTV